jgi:hypothetical protein
MSNIIQIRRSIANSTVTGLANGELAFTANGKVFYIGDPSDGSSIRIGGEQVPGTLTANQALVANSTSGIDNIIVANLAPTGIFANGAMGASNQLLASDAGGNVYWLDQGAVSINVDSTYSWTNVHSFSANLNANVVNATSFTIGTDLIANSSNIVFTTGTITANAFYGNGASITSVDAATVGGNSASDLRSFANDMASNAYSNAMSDTLSRNGVYTGNNEFSNGTTFSSNVTLSGYFNSNVVPQANVSHNLGSAELNWKTVYANTVNAVSGNFSGNVAVLGDLTVTGNLTTIDINSVVVSDPLIYLAGNNTTTDTVDIGFVGQYYGDTLIRNAGLFRDHDDGIFKLFTHLAQDVKANNNIDIADSSYNIATLQAYLNSGALVSNSLTVTITANSTVNVNITANSLVLSSPLLGNSGGTGLSSYSNNDLMIANSTNGFTPLAFNANVGYVLQSNGTAIVYDKLDGGTF